MGTELEGQRCNPADRAQHIEELERIRNARIAEILVAEKPLKGIYCVYSMYWRPRLAHLED